MTDNLAPSEFGGRVQRNGLQPLPHTPTASEELSLVYRTGDTAVDSLPDSGEAFAGLLPLAEQTQLMKDEGLLEKGQYDVRLAADGG